MASLSYFPVVETERQLIDLLSRAAWYLSFCALDRIFVPISSEELANSPWIVAEGMDASIAEKFELLRHKLEFILVRQESDLQACMLRANIVLRWKKDSVPSFVSSTSLAAWERGKKVLQVDPVAIRQEGSFYIDVGFSLLGDRKSLTHENQLKFQRFASKLGRFDRAYIMATGPSIAQYPHFDYSKALSIVCNSVINDEDLMEIVRPQILVFADPIFHFGPSQYAATFRAKLAESAQRHDYTICIPIKYYPLFTAAMPQLADRTIAMPFLKDREFNFDLRHEFELKTTANILTFLMVPLASSFADEIGILGCDGRPLTENTYFWGHNANTQFNDKMANIRVVHPGFFNIDYNEYYLEHCKTLEAELSAGEAIGKKFVSLSFSHIPALNGRYGRGKRLSGLFPRAGSTNFVFIDTCITTSADPNWAYLDEVVKAASSSVARAVAICRNDVDPAALASRPNVLGILTPIVADITAPDHEVTQAPGFGSFEDAVSQMCSMATDVLIYIPRATLYEAKVLAALVTRHPNARLHLNIIPPGDENGVFEDASMRSFVAWISDAEPRIVATVPDASTRARFAELTGCVFRVASAHPGNFAVQGCETDRQALANSVLFPEIEDRSTTDPYPRLLVIDLTNMGGVAATSRIKDAFFGTWPDEQFRLVCQEAGKEKRLVLADKQGKQLLAAGSSIEQILDAATEYHPDVIYYRAVEDQMVHGFASVLLSRCAAPLVIHLMDDWPARLKATNPGVFPELDRSLRTMLQRAVQRLSIGERMSRAFEERYGHKFLAFANGIDPSNFPPKIWAGNANRPFVIRYTGALAKDMTFDSICDIAESIELLSEKIDIRLEIYTRQPWLKQAKERFSEFRAVSILNQVRAEDYNGLLQQADALLIAYNFDELSQTYIGYSMANKLPEYLASGTPVIAYGPPACATISYVRNRACAVIIEQRNRGLIFDEIKRLVASRELQMQLGLVGRSVAFIHHNVWKVQMEFQRVLSNAAREVERARIGPFSRYDASHWDETSGIAELFSRDLSGTTMIDVGAHHGSALMPFLNNDWRVFAFEPDEKNAKKLLARLARHKNRGLVTLDTRCISNKSQKSVSFFTSEQSAGISGLSAFHETHVETQKVDITTLTEFFEDKPLPGVDFLKIDTEGHDLFVLQGFPWERGKPAVIECEFEDTKTVPLGYTFHDLAGFLVDKGYTVYVSEWHPIIRYGIRHDWRQLMRYPCELADPKGWGNLLAFGDPIDEQALVAAVKKVLKVGAGESAQKPAASAQPALPIPVSGANLGFRFEPGAHFTSIGPNQWRFSDAEAKQKLWVAAMESPGPTAGRSFVGSLRVMADRAMTVNISLTRYGASPYEGVSERVMLTPNVWQVLDLKKLFSSQHAHLKLQLDVVDLPGRGSAVLTIDSLGVCESIESVLNRLGGSSIDMRHANQLYRDGDRFAALALYLFLERKHCLPMYGDNAARAARASGMPWVKQAQDLAWLQ